MPPTDRPERRTDPRRTPRPPAAGEDRLDLWLLRQAAAAGVTALDLSDLDEHERRRAASFLRPADGLLYASAHLGLRRLLGAYLGLPAREVRFFRELCPGCGGPHGRPAVAASLPLHFSLSHSSGLALIGVAAVPVGVDIERLLGAETVDVCAPALHPDEQTELSAAAGQVRSDRFSRIWTRKEAYLKGIGTGLSRSPAADYLGADPARHPAGWTVLDVPCTPTHAASAAVRGAAPRTTGVRWLTGDWHRAADITPFLRDSAQAAPAA
jgi:4'-phosphopantetheinyl transferase